MEKNKLKPRKALNKSFLKVKPNRTDIERFKAGLIQLLDRTNDTESEEFHKNLVSDFLKKTYYEPNHYINTKGRNDLVIHNGDKAQSTVGVIIEAKKPTNRSEMVTAQKLNGKAFQELVLYYLRERITQNNFEVRHLVITNIYEWFIFDAATFDRLFAQNKKLVQQFNEFDSGRLAETKTEFFYKQIAEPAIAAADSEIEFTYFNLHDYEKPLRNQDDKDDNTLIALFKVLSPEHLLKLPFANDSNSLDKRFYSELLHIIGLTETKEGGKKLIQRRNEGDRHSGSLLEDAIIQLDSLDKMNRIDRPGQFGASHTERLFNVGLELCITWINRILFLKLLEAQLITYHRFDKLTARKGDSSYAFLNLEKIKDYDGLNRLFFQVLAKTYSERNQDVQKAFEKVPYLNSSLFEPTDIEHSTIFISNLSNDKSIPIIGKTVLKNEQGKKRSGQLPTLEYLFEFLNAYDFSSEGSEEIQEDNKTLINASVLGLIFEKINGYKDGSFFTPGFITMYMCRETIRKAILQKFNETKQWNCQSIDELYDKIEDRTEANTIINSIKICDPAVGSGHFLVSSLNELIAVKSELKILQDRNGRRLKEYVVEVANDELAITDEEGELFEYNPNNPESQRIQETLFHEKQTMIENCLFGVDINPNSVKICRLRLWIELLKSAYYKADPGIKNPAGTSLRTLETLPNIDINIKCGNSLVSRFAIDANLNQALKKSKWTIDSYRLAVATYRNAESKEQKREMERLIADIKSDFRANIDDPFKGKLAKARGTVDKIATEINTQKLWGEKVVKTLIKDLEKATERFKKLEAERDEIASNKIFENAFEWRFEFPEVLNDKGDFVGFDVVIGNPPYIRQEELTELKPYLQSHFSTYAGTADLYVYFVELGMNILAHSGQFSYIIPNKWMRAGYGSALRDYVKNFRILEIVDFGDLPVFEEATTYPCVMLLQKSPTGEEFKAVNVSTLEFPNGLESYLNDLRYRVLLSGLRSEGWTLVNADVQRLLDKIRSKGVPLKEYVDGKIFYGIKTGLNEAFVIDETACEKLIAEDPRSAEIIKPFLAGRDIKRYKQPKSDKYLILFKSGDTRNWFGDGLSESDAKAKMKEAFPAVMNWFEPFESKAKARYDKGHYWWEMRACDYYEEFEESKIVWPETSLNNQFCYVDEGIYLNKTTFMIPLFDNVLLGILNSKLAKFYFNSIVSKMRGGYFSMSKAYVETLPIIGGNYPEIEQLVTEILAVKTQEAAVNYVYIETQIDQFVYELYELTEEEIKIVEKI